MKALILVDSVGSIPSKHRQNLLVINQLNWTESFHFLEGKSTDQYIFVHENCPFERLLKLVEEYQGNLAVYTTQLVDSVFLSRFTRVVSRRSISPDLTFGQKGSLDQTLSELKQVLC